MGGWGPFKTLHLHIDIQHFQKSGEISPLLYLYIIIIISVICKVKNCFLYCIYNSTQKQNITHQHYILRKK